MQINSQKRHRNLYFEMRCYARHRYIRIGRVTDGAARLAMSKLNLDAIEKVTDGTARLAMSKLNLDAIEKVKGKGIKKAPCSVLREKTSLR